ncbi:MAG: helix-turn-helix domain-containing protein [Fimbriimonadaceae bacterium]
MAKKFDPISYIEEAFVDHEARTKRGTPRADADLDVELPSLAAYVGENGVRPASKPGVKFRRTKMSAPRPRRHRDEPEQPPIEPELRGLWENLPKHLEFLFGYFDDAVTANYYDGFRESREQLVRRLLDPELTLEEVSRLLGVCPATVRRYTNRGWLSHHRTGGGQRRFRLSDVVQFVDRHGRFPEERGDA